MCTQITYEWEKIQKKIEKENEYSHFLNERANH